MKRIFLLSILIGTAFCTAGGITATMCIRRYPHNSNRISTQYPDTVKYLYDNFIAQKEKYEHKELSVLLNDLHLSVKSYIPTRPSKPGGPSKSLILRFESPSVIYEKLVNQKVAPFLIIDFEPPLPYGNALELFFNSQGVWSDAEKDFFGKQIVKEVRGLKPGTI